MPQCIAREAASQYGTSPLSEKHKTAPAAVTILHPTGRTNPFPGKCSRSAYAAHCGQRKAIGRIRIFPALERSRAPVGRGQRFRVHPAVMVGQDGARLTRPVGQGASADLAAGDRKMGHGHRETGRTRFAHYLLLCQTFWRQFKYPRQGRGRPSRKTAGMHQRNLR